jgi:hypothetical protein
MLDHAGPVVSDIPRDLTGSIDFHRHHLRNASALDDDNEGADTAGMTTAFFATGNVGENEGIADVGPWDNVGGVYRESR